MAGLIEFFRNNHPEVGTWAAAVIALFGFGLTIWQVRGARTVAERAIERLHRVGGVSDMATALKTIDEVTSALQRDQFEVAHIRIGDLRTLVTQIRQLVPTDEQTQLQPHTTNLRLIHDLLGDVVAGEPDEYNAGAIRRLLSELREVMQDLQAVSRATGGN